MMPCSSGNSPTMAVKRSALASSAARATSAPAEMRSPIERASDLTRARILSRVAAELRLERDAAQLLRRALPERTLRSWSQKNAASDEPRAHHALVALAHLRRVAAFDVAHRDESAGQRPSAPSIGEIPLMVLNRRDHHFARQLEKALLEAAGDRHRPFDQRRDFIEQAHSRSSARPPAACGRGGHAGAHCARAACRNRQSLSRSPTASRSCAPI